MKVSAEEAVGRVSGVSVIVNSTVVRVDPSSRPNDTDLAQTVERGLAAASSVPDSVRAETSGARVRLTGVVRGLPTPRR